MFKKRLKGLLAMVLAGSIALSALPMSASAKIYRDVTIKGGDLDNSTVYVSDIGETSFTGGVLHDNTDYLNDNNMWAVTSYSGGSSGQINATVSGDNLAKQLYGYKKSFDSLSDTYIKYSHKYVVTTDDPTTTITDADNASPATTFPVTVSSPLASITGYTVWYGIMNNGMVASGDVVAANVTETLSEPVDSISIPMSAFKGLYTTYIPNSYGTKTFQDGVTIIQLTYQTLDIPVLNGNGKPEMDGGNPYTLSVTGGCYDYLDDDKNWYYVGYTKQNGEVVLSDCEVDKKDSAWAKIEEFAANDPNFDVNTLFFLRTVYVHVNKDSSEIGSFTSKDLYQSLAKNDPENLPDAYKYIVDADANSIWRTDTPQKYVLGKDLLKGIETYLDNNPSVFGIYLRETTEIMVTGTDPNQIESTESYEKSPLYVEDTEADPVQTVPATISDHAAVLAKSVAPEAGNIYDTSNWQLWGCEFEYADVGEKKPICNFYKSALESTNGVTSIGIDQLNTVPLGYSPLIYFPQVKIAPSLEVTAPVVGIAPSTGATIKDTIGGYTVTSVSWPLTSEDMFEAGKQYTVTVTLEPDAGLAFTEDTSVMINGEAPTAKNLNQDDGTLTVSYTFDELKDPWQDIENKLDDTLNGENPTIEIPADNPTIPKNVLEDIKASGKEVTIIYPNSNDDTGNYKWIIDGSSITNIREDGVNLSITVDNSEWATVINNITGDRTKMQISIQHNEALGFTAYLEINLKSVMGNVDPAGSYVANLYLVNNTDNKLEWKAYSRLTPDNDGNWNAKLRFDHCSDWLITIDDKNMDPASDNNDNNNNNSGSGSSGSSGNSRPSGSSTTIESSTPMFGGKAMSWSDIVAELKKLPIGSEVTIELNGITNVPFEVINVIGERKLKTTFKFDSVRSWKLNGAEITAPAAADLSIIAINRLKTDSLRGISGYQFTMNDTNIPTGIEIAFKTEYAGQFANLYKVVDGKLTFVTCAKVGADGKVILPGVADQGDYVAMLSELSDVLGDMNNDGVLDQKDASAILKDIVGLEQGKNPLMADFNGDGAIDQKDASAILKSIVGLA